MNPTLQFKVNSSKVIHETIDGEVVIVNLDNGNYYSLANVGADIWTRIDDAPVGEIIAETVQRYEGVPQEIEASVKQLVTDLQKEGIIVAVEETRTSNDGGFKPRHGSENGKLPFSPPILQKYDDMQDLLLLDPIHEVDEVGWPNVKPD